MQPLAPAPLPPITAVNIGTLTVGKTVTIQFQVTVNTPLPTGTTQVSNQGTVSGTNFATVNTSDPGPPVVNGPTVTPIENVALSINDVSVAEGAIGQRSVNFTVSLSFPIPQPISVHYNTVNGTATAPTDYTAIPDTVLNIPANTASATITVMVNGDTIFEGNETFTVHLSNPTGADITDADGVGTIADDEPQVADLTGDGRTDVSVWDSSTGNWYVVDSSNNQFSQFASWGSGALGDIPVPGDYDGDNRIDVAVFRPSEGNWYIIKSNNGVPQGSVQNWGQSGDIPVQGDYDGDGKTDLAVWRPSQGNWYVKKSTGGTTVKGWGLSSDKPVVGDFDGDGRTDMTVFRPSEGNWYILKSNNGGAPVGQVRNWGTASDKLTPGDFDGDGKTDIAFWRPSDSNWYILNSSDGTTTTRSWGLPSDVPVPGDYDGDGKFDIAVFRPSEGNFYIIGSSSGGMVQNVGGVGANIKPVPNAYLPQ